MDYALSEGFQLLTVNTRSSSQEYIDSQKRYATNLKRQYSEDLDWLATFSMEGFEEPGWAETVEHRFLSGLTLEETADIQEVSVKTIQRNWTRAKLVLYQSLRQKLGET